jgi:hypothetical protein
MKKKIKRKVTSDIYYSHKPMEASKRGLEIRTKRDIEIMQFIFCSIQRCNQDDGSSFRYNCTRCIYSSHRIGAFKKLILKSSTLRKDK